MILHPWLFRIQLEWPEKVFENQFIDGSDSIFHQPKVPGPPLKGPWILEVIQPP